MRIRSLEYIPSANVLQICEDREGQNHRGTVPSNEAGSEGFVASLLPLPAVEESGIKMISFSPETALIRVDGRAVTPSDDITNEAPETQAFCNAVWDNGGRRLYQAKQKVKELKNAQSDN